MVLKWSRNGRAWVARQFGFRTLENKEINTYKI